MYRPLRALALLIAVMPLHSLAQQQPASESDLRPRVHFSPEQNWTNDPNGLVYFDGEYHLFYQYAPESMTPAHMSWGHAVSTDLLHWQELGVAIPARGEEAIFTGSVVVDEHNTSGLCKDGKACLVAIYTGNYGSGKTQQEVQEIAVSQDRGRTFTPYNGNPVLDLHMSDYRDPGVLWDEESKRWTMVVALPNMHQVYFYTSPDLKTWTKVSSFGPTGAVGGQWECPNLVKVSDASGTSLWALKIGINPGGLQGGSGEQYFLGSFDGKQFTQSTESGSHGWSDYGKDSYCALSYNNRPAGHKPALIGWMDNWQYADRQPSFPWRGQMTVPRTLTLLRDKAGIALAEEPVVSPLRTGKAISISLSADDKGTLLGQAPMELNLKFIPTDAKIFGVRLYSDDSHWTELGFDLSRQRMWMDRTHSGMQITSSFPTKTEAPISLERPLDLRLVLDRISVESFAQNGSIAMTNLVFPLTSAATLKPFTEDGKGIRITGEAWHLQSTLAAKH
ncbi:glycoside hydrolase family 32 protein [Terriglobus sp. TAA 43]|uniref:glycoside hydrolase family 32 protein n=1 Tax=Terriglobus sp. TAA 43 TaxID=278961 RepID=UPI00068CDA58|nr:glycoside hydrolase family 32 protein [Terriglobus sp. TAA 43]